MTYPNGSHRDGKRNRERKSKRIVTRWEWPGNGRPVVVVEMTSCGEPLVRMLPTRSKVSGADREAAAAWLSNLYPRWGHEAAYVVLWFREGKG